MPGSSTLAAAKQSWWQVLPLGPTGYGDSPYQCFSAFAGNPNLISPELLVADQLIQPSDLDGISFPGDHVDYARVIDFKSRLTERAWARFQVGEQQLLVSAFIDFCRRHAAWLDDFALFMAIKGAHGQRSWQEWPEALRRREAGALEQAQRDLADSIELHKFRQFLFFRQWAQLQRPRRSQGDSLHWRYADLRGARLRRRVGESAPVSARRESPADGAWPAFRPIISPRPASSGETRCTIGRRIEDTGFEWWVSAARGGAAPGRPLRLDHFRGFEAAWHVPAGEPTAQNGRWVPGPGAELFRVAISPKPGPPLQGLREALPLIAEDLGVITPEVDELRQELGLPGMRIMQFAFGGATEERFLPHNYERHTVVYTGTHDNNTTAGWYEELTPEELRHFRSYVPDSGAGPAWDLIRLAWASVAELAVTPLQDVLGLGNEARMNMPGRPSGNWRWRATEAQIAGADWDKLAVLTTTYQR